MKVHNMVGRKGNAVANQFRIVEDDGTEWFQSYDTVIARKREGHVTLDEAKWNYSRTTSKYRNQFLGESTKETQAKIDSREYFMADLNE